MPKYEKLPVLDKGFVALVDHMGSDRSIAAAARVQPEAEWRDPEANPKLNDPKLLATMMLGDHPHASPFEKGQLSFWVKAPIFVYRQWHRHRTWSYNEQSARYMEMKPEFYIPSEAAIGVQAKKNHQSRDMTENLNAQQIRHVMLLGSTQAHEDYLELLENGCPRELARMVLPVNLYSEMVATVSLWNLMKFLDLRDHPDAQWEIQQYAMALSNLASQKFPISMALYYERRAQHLETAK